MRFSFIKAAVTTRQAAVLYGLKVNRSGMACCPFHNDHHPSMKVDERYYCFACHESGDVIDFVGKLFGISPYDAAQKIAADFGLNPDAPSASVAVVQAQKNDEKNQRESERRCIRVLTEYEGALKTMKDGLAPKNPDEEWNSRFGDACHSLPQVSWLIDSLYSASAEERMEMICALSESGTLGEIEAWLNQWNKLIKEESAYGENESKAA